jgi:DNA-binding response OmpR family regulator
MELPPRPDSKELVALMSSASARELQLAARDVGFAVCVIEDVREMVVRIEADCPRVVVVDSDWAGDAEVILRFARSLRADVFLVGVTYFWSDRDEILQPLADAVLHKPLRRSECTRVLRCVSGVQP